MDTPFLDLLRPLYVFSSIFCNRKYSVHNEKVFTISLKEVLITLSANCILIFLFYFTFRNTEFEELSLKLYYLVIYGQHVFSFVIISCHNMKLSKIFVALIGTLQKIYNFERNQYSSMASKRRLKISCGILIYIYFGVIIPKLVLDPYWNWARALFLGLTIALDFELFFIILVIRFLASKFKTWSRVLSKFSSEQKNYNCSSNYINTKAVNQSIQRIEILGDDEHDKIIEEYFDGSRRSWVPTGCEQPTTDRCGGWGPLSSSGRQSPHGEDNDDDNCEGKKLFEVFDLLVDGTNLMKSASQFTIFFHAITLFSQSLVYIAVLILWIKQAAYDINLMKSVLISHSTGIIMWILKALVLQALMGNAMERLYTGVRASRTAASVLVARRHDLATTRSAKNALRLSCSRPCRFKAAGALPVDAALPLRLAALVGAYTVVLLQFALSK